MSEGHEANRPHRFIDSRSLTWYLVFRTAVITLLLGGAAVFYLKGTVHRSVIPPLFGLIGVTYAQALVSALLLKKIKRTELFAQMQIAWDLLFVTVLIILTGGVESVFPFAYLLVIISTSFLLSRRLTVLAAACAVILFGGVLDLQYFDYLQLFNLNRSVPSGTFFSALFVHAVAFFLTAVLSGTLADRWRRSEAQLQLKNIDFAELEKMNRTILAHINSGLMLVNPQGRIRSFNRAAAEITDLSLQEVYDQSVTRFFPELEIGSELADALKNRAEGLFRKNSGEELILGYATTPAHGSRGEDLGVLVTFQDLTQLKKIEDDLKRADRLAAVGRLAAAMAHEVRNPLASISGSVQMLMEAQHVPPEDQRLMGIVVSEADRLSALLTDFLNFARPKPPVKESVDIEGVFQELVAMLKGDSRFSQLEIAVECPTGYCIALDRSQIFQVLWDLAINAAEALDGPGRLVFRVPPRAAEIVVDDDGPGIADDARERIFEPFFSTKEKGTGLGLASVYSVMEAHAGSVDIARSDFGGARFILKFPTREDH